jgi:hypothetical protein
MFPIFTKKKFESFIQKFSRMVFPKSDEGKEDCTNIDMARSFNSTKKQQFITMQGLGQQRIWRLLRGGGVIAGECKKMKVLMKMMTSSIQFVWKD